MLLDLVQPFLRATVSLEFAEISITNIPAEQGSDTGLES